MRFFGYKFDVELLGHIVFALWVGICINAVKWSAGTDGLMEGIVAIAALIFFLIGIRTFDLHSSIFAAILLGSIVAFLFYNFYPSKIFSGSAGKSVYGFILGVLAVLSEAKFAFAILVLALPIVDMLWVMYGRARRSGEKSPLKMIAAMNRGDNTHLHHQLLKLGFRERQVAYIEYLITSALGVIAFLLTGSLRTVIIIVAFVAVGAGIIYLSNLTSRKSSKKTDDPTKKS